MTKSNELILIGNGQDLVMPEAGGHGLADAPASRATARRVNAINRLHEQIDLQLTDAVRGCLYAAYQIGRIVEEVQAKAPYKMKTAAVEELALSPDLRLSRAQLYRYLRLAKKLPELVDAPSEKFLTVRKNEFLDLVGDLSLADAWSLVSGQSSAAAKKLLGPPETPANQPKATQENIARNAAGTALRVAACSAPFSRAAPCAMHSCSTYTASGMSTRHSCSARDADAGTAAVAAVAAAAAVGGSVWGATN